MWSRRRARLVALPFAAVLLGWGAGLWGTGMPAAGAASSPHATLVLDGQSQWVTPAAGGSTGTFTLDLAARGAPAGAQVAVALYPRLDTRDRFEEVVDHGPRTSPLSQASPVPLSQLPADPHTPGGVDLALQVGSGTSTGGQALGLSCAGATGSSTCTGVYPVTVSLLDGSGNAVHRFTTFLTYSAGSSRTPLAFGWVLPIAAPVAVMSAGSSPTFPLAPLSHTDVARLTQLVTAVAANASVPVTIDASPATLTALSAAGPAARAAIATLATLSTNQSVDEVPQAPYVPIDLSSLAGAGESTEIKGQMAAGVTVLHRLRVQTAAALPWVATGAVGNDLGSGLSQVGAREVVVQETALAPTPTAPSVTWASTFHLSLGTRSGAPVDAAETDPFLDGQFRHAGTDPVLAATQILADLAMVHFERPNTRHLRGLVAVPPPDWAPNATFVRTLLGGLSGNPVVTPVTLSRFFATVTPSTTTRTLKANSPGPALARSVARSMSRARLRLTQFAEAVRGRPAVLSQLDHLLLASESDELVRPSRAGAMATFNRVLTRQIRLVTFAIPKTVTLTARTGVIPITVVSSAKYTIVGTLRVSGAKFVFPDRAANATHTMVLDHATNTWRVSVRARSSGDLPLEVRFTSASGQLVIATDQLTIRSTATSLVGIVLTALALAVLLSWWARTWRTKRRARRRTPEPVDQAEPLEGGW